MILRPLGHIFGPAHCHGCTSHTQVPTAIVLDSVIRVYFSARDCSNKSYIAFADFDRQDPTHLISANLEPSLAPSLPGTFDEDGAMPGHVLRVGNELWMYYTGWNQKISTPYHNSMGLAKSVDGGKTFERAFDGPIMDRTIHEPYLAVTPSILNDGEKFRAWYNAGTGWTNIGGLKEAVYVVKTATSKDGIHWERSPQICFSPKFENECASHPTVSLIDGTYHMMFCHRGVTDYRDGINSYRMGYAHSQDGLIFQRDDEAIQLDGSYGDWASQMQCYPFFLNIDQRMLMYYNGNGFGKSGFGLAEVEF